MKNTHVNIPVFIPHLGCPNMCVFCNQRAISGVCSFIPERAREGIETVLSTVRGTNTDCEIAFFGGSFTGIDRELMITLLDLAESYVKAGEVTGIRMSTRPDYIDEEIVSVLEGYTITAVELGIQSFSDAVLAASRRGHTAAQSEQAMRLLRAHGFSTVGQMMIGLPGARPDDEIACAERICELGASGCRIYPTVVFRDTELCRMMEEGAYTPLTIDEAVTRSAAALDVFVRHGVNCLRIGLCDSENLHTEASYAAGPNHPAIGELVQSELYFRRICDALEREAPRIGAELLISVPQGDISKAVGQKRKNRDRIMAKYSVSHVKFLENASLERYHIMLENRKSR